MIGPAPLDSGGSVANRNKGIMVYLEMGVWALLEEGVLNNHISASAHIRRLILKDLKERDLLSQEILELLVTGENKVPEVHAL
jgi:hypothetical protein